MVDMKSGQNGEKISNIMNNSTARLWGSMHFAYIKSVFMNFLLNEKLSYILFFYIYIIYISFLSAQTEAPLKAAQKMCDSRWHFPYGALPGNT